MNIIAKSIAALKKNSSNIIGNKTEEKIIKK